MGCACSRPDDDRQTTGHVGSKHVQQQQRPQEQDACVLPPAEVLADVQKMVIKHFQSDCLVPPMEALLYTASRHSADDKLAPGSPWAQAPAGCSIPAAHHGLPGSSCRILAFDEAAVQGPSGHDSGVNVDEDQALHQAKQPSKGPSDLQGHSSIGGVDPTMVATLCLMHSHGRHMVSCSTVAKDGMQDSRLPLGLCQLPGRVIHWLACECGFVAYGSPPSPAMIETDPKASIYFCAALCQVLSIHAHLGAAGLQVQPEEVWSPVQCLHLLASMSQHQAGDQESSDEAWPQVWLQSECSARPFIPALWPDCKPLPRLPPPDQTEPDEPDSMLHQLVVGAYHMNATPSLDLSQPVDPAALRAACASAWAQYLAGQRLLNKLCKGLAARKEVQASQQVVTMYVAGQGDTLASIAAAVQCSEAQVLEANPGLCFEPVIRQHDCLALPVPSIIPRLYCMQAQDSLCSVAIKHGHSLNRLLNCNPILRRLNPRTPHPGWILEVPSLYGHI